MDFAAVLREVLLPALEPVWMELRHQSAIISQLAEEVAGLKAGLGKDLTSSMTKSCDDLKAAERKAVIQPQRSGLGLRSCANIEDLRRSRGNTSDIKKKEEKTVKPRPKPDVGPKRLIEVRSDRMLDTKKQLFPATPAKKTHGTVGKSLEEPKKRPIIRKSLTEKRLIEKAAVDEQPREEEKRVETEVREERVSIDMSAQIEAVEPTAPDRAEAIPHKGILETPESVLTLPDFESTPRLASIDRELRTLIEVTVPQTFGEQSLQSSSPFQLSLGTRGALSLLSTLEESQLYIGTQPSHEEVYWVFRLFFQLCGETLSPDRTEAWKCCQQFIVSGLETGLEEKVLESVAGFDFSNQNIDVVEKIVGEKTEQVTPNMCSSFCNLASLLLFPVKEAVMFAGLLPEKAQPWRRYQRLVHKRRQGRDS